MMGAGNAHAEYYPSGIQQNVSEQTLRNNGWRLFYQKEYGNSISLSASELRPSEKYVLVTGKQVNVNTLSVLAAAPTANVFNTTTTNSPVLINGTYWYLTPDESFGFSPSPTIFQSSADIVSSPYYDVDLGDGEKRLSWHLGIGGWRLGNFTNLNTSTEYLKQIWMWDGIRGTDADPELQAKRKTTNLSFEESLFGSDILSDSDGKLRQIVDLVMKNVPAEKITNLID
jgi:hypothetical protein